jgi:hypothetical protein
MHLKEVRKIIKNLEVDQLELKMDFFDKGLSQGQSVKQFY